MRRRVPEEEKGNEDHIDPTARHSRLHHGTDFRAGSDYSWNIWRSSRRFIHPCRRSFDDDSPDGYAAQHALVEAIVGPVLIIGALALLPATTARWFYIAMGVIIVGVWLLSSYESSNEGGATPR